MTAVFARPRKKADTPTEVFAKPTPGYQITATSMGQLLVVASEVGVMAVALGDDDADFDEFLNGYFPRREVVPEGEPRLAWIESIRCFLDGQAPFPSLPLDANGTPFQKEVWRHLQQIPFGTTVTYKQLAERMGRPEAVRAVARACGANPIAVLVPCHRVVGSDGSLTGYRWGVQRKKALLRLEANQAPFGV